MHVHWTILFGLGGCAWKEGVSLGALIGIIKLLDGSLRIFLSLCHQ